MIEILDPKKLYPTPLVENISDGWHYPLDYTWILSVLREFTVAGENILDVGAGLSKLWTMIERDGYNCFTMERAGVASYKDYDFVGDFRTYDFGKFQPDVILWSSSIEHQETMDDYRACFQKSMDMLVPGGLFIATFPLAQVSGWYDPAKQWNLSLLDAMRLFGEDTARGKYYKIWDSYRNNLHSLRDRYVKRFGRWDVNDPVYLAGGVVKVK